MTSKSKENFIQILLLYIPLWFFGMIFLDEVTMFVTDTPNELRFKEKAINMCSEVDGTYISSHPNNFLTDEYGSFVCMHNHELITYISVGNRFYVEPEESEVKHGN